MSESNVGHFDKRLSRHLAQLLRAGMPCDETLIRSGYYLTRWELGLGPDVRKDRFFREVEAFYVGLDLAAVAHHEGTIRRLPFNQASQLVFALLQGELVEECQ